MAKLYFVVFALNELFHYHVFVSSSFSATNKTSQAITNLKNESSNMVKEDRIIPKGILSAILDKKLGVFTNQMTCRSWDDRFILDALSLGSGFVTEKEWMKVRQKTKGKKPKIMDITTPRMTNMKEISRLVSKYIVGVRSYVLRPSKKFLNIPAIFDLWYRDFNTSINIGLECDPVLLYKFLPAESINEIRHILQQYSSFCRDRGNNGTTITPEHTIIEIRQQIYNVMLQSEFLVKIFSEMRRNLFQSRVKSH